MKLVIQGSKAVFSIRLGEKDNNGIVDPFDLTGHTAATPRVCWKAGSTKIEKPLTDPDITIIGAETKGEIEAVLDASETSTFPAGEIGSVEIIVDKGSGDVTVFQLLDSWQVVKKICD